MKKMKKEFGQFEDLHRKFVIVKLLDCQIVIEEDAPRCAYNYDLTIRKLATVQGKRFFIRPNVIHQYSYKHDKEKERKQRIVNHQAYTQKDLVEIDLPEGYTAESLPENIDIQTDFGTYKATCEVSGNQLLYNRTLTVNSYDLPPDCYQDMLEFYRQVKASDLKKAVFIK